MRSYNSSRPRCMLSYLCGMIDMSKSNSSGFPAEIRITSTHIPTQSSSRHSAKGCSPHMVKLSDSLVTWLAFGIVLRTTTISRNTTGSGASHFIMAEIAKMWRFGSCLRSTRPARLSSSCWETCQIRVISIAMTPSYRLYSMPLVDYKDITLPVCCKRHR